MKVVKAINEIKRKIEYEQSKLDNRGKLGLNSFDIIKAMATRDGLELALEIIENNR